MKTRELCNDYKENVALMDEILRPDANFDLIKKRLSAGSAEFTFYYIDGFVKDAVMQKLMTHILTQAPTAANQNQNGAANQKSKSGARKARGFVAEAVPYVETDVTANVDLAVQMVMSGAALMLGSDFGEEVVIIDARTYPARETGEPEGDKVMRGARDGFVEALIFNTALIRRRIRNPALTMSYFTVGESSRTDVVVCYMSDRADGEYVRYVKDRISEIKTDSLTMGHESLAECLIKQKWYNPINSSVLSLLYGLTLTSIHNYWENHSFDYMDLCWQSDVCAF